MNESPERDQQRKNTDRRRRRPPVPLTTLAEVAGVAGFIFAVLVYFDVL